MQDEELSVEPQQQAVGEDGNLATALEETDPSLAPPEEVGEVGGAATLTVKRSGAETDVCFPINPPATIGRFDPTVGPIDVDLGSLPEGVYVSRKHAKITCDDGVWKVVDLGSSNGTFVLREDFEKVDEAEIGNGTEIALGNARFVFKLG